MNTRARIERARTLGYDSIRALPVYPALPARIIGLGAAVTTLAAWTGAAFTGTAFKVTMLVAVPVTLWWFIREVHRPQTTKGEAERRGDRLQRAGGVASIWDVMQRSSPAAMRRQVPILRPSLAGEPRWRRRAAQAGFLIATTGFRFHHGQQLWSSIRDATLTVGSPGTGKTQFLTCLGMAAPGAVITTSTKEDLAENMHRVRSVYPETVRKRRTWRTLWLLPRLDWSTGVERDVHFFNTSNESTIRSTVRWRVLHECWIYTTATRRAADLLPASAAETHEVWLELARTFLPVMLYAAEVSGGSVATVLHWIALFSSNATRDVGRRELVAILLPRPHGRVRVDVLDAFLSAPDRGRGSAMMLMTQALAWMNDDLARQIGDAPRDTTTLNPREVILNRETLHIIGQGQKGNAMARLISTLVAEIAWQARHLGSESPRGRLDPSLTLIVDEAARATQLPLDEWTADMGGRGVTIHAAVQSLSQLEECWGETGADTLRGNVGATILFGGGQDAKALGRYSTMLGERWRRVITKDTKVWKKIAGVQRGEWEKVAVLDESQLANMPYGQAAIIQRGLGGAFIGYPPQAMYARGWAPVSLRPPAILEPPVPIQVAAPEPAVEPAVGSEPA